MRAELRATGMRCGDGGDGGEFNVENCTLEEISDELSWCVVCRGINNQNREQVRA